MYIAEDAVVENSVLGPYVAIESGAYIGNSVIRDSIVFESAEVTDAVLNQSMVGANSSVSGKATQLNVGDHSHLS